MLLRAVERGLAAAGVAREGAARVLVACSGGPDSMALVRAAVGVLGPDRVVVGHVDHGARAGSAAVASALRAFCASVGLELLSERLEPPRIDEATLRRLRYAALERMRLEAGAELVLVAHTQDDQAETVLLGLVRGGGLGSLAGMAERNGALLRPWLDVPRHRVHAYLSGKGWPSWDDPTNREPAYLRNRIRKELLPLLERRYAPALRRRLSRLGAEVRALRRSGAISEAAVDLAGEPGPVERGIRIAHLPAADAPPEEEGLRAVFDAAEVAAPRLRPARAHDVVSPALGGPVPVGDVLAASGVPAALRTRWPLVVDEEDRVLWGPGLPRAAVAAARDGARHVWVFELGPA